MELPPSVSVSAVVLAVFAFLLLAAAVKEAFAEFEASIGSCLKWVKLCRNKM